MKTKLHYLVIALFGLALFACEENQSEIQPQIDDLTSVADNSTREEMIVCPDPVTYPLNFDGVRTAGEVSISNDEMYMYVTVYSPEGFHPSINPDIYLFVDADFGNLPLNAWNFPDLDMSKFNYTADVEGTEHTFEIPLAEIPGYNRECGVQELYFFVAANVKYSGATITTYAGSTFVDGSAPWWYDTYTPQCCEEVIMNCETAFAKFPVEANGITGYVFTENANANPENYLMLGIDTRWGWAGAFCAEGEYEFPVWAAAGQNNTEKGTLVGMLHVDVTDGSVEVCYDMYNDYDMSELHIYASSDAPTTAAPGQYGYTLEFENGASDHCASFEFDGECVWVIAHAVVCGEFDMEEEDGE